MKKAFQLSVTVNDLGTRSGMTLVYTDLKAAQAQLEIITNHYGVSWNVPPQGDDKWHIFAATQDLACITLEHTADDGNCDRSYTGMITECNLMQKGDEVAFMPGTVVKLTENPKVCMQIADVMLKGGKNINTRYPIDLETGEPVQPDMGNIDLCNQEEAQKYYELFDKITKVKA